MKRALLIAFALSGCHLANNDVPPLSCYDRIIVTCTACVNRGCAWCPSPGVQGSGYCCEGSHTGPSSSHCPAPITNQNECVETLNCDQLPISSCGDCLGRGCGWCPDESRCHAKQGDGTFAACGSGSQPVSGTMSCPP